MASEGMDKLIRPELIALGGYSPHRSPDTLEGEMEVPVEKVIKLDANENPYGCSPRVRQALTEYSGWEIYPDAGQTRLRRQLQEYTGVDAGCIVAANGSGELLDDILCLLLEPGDEVINCIPTFDMYRTRTLINKGKLVNVPRDEDFSVNIGAVKAAVTPKTKLVILANPNNPTGMVTPKSDILELVATGVPVLVDEAYYEFCGETVAPLVSQYKNLMVLRTFSKWAGLAGLRVGYGIFPPEVAGYLLKIKLPYNVNLAALVAVRESLNDVDYLMERVKAIIAERERLFEELKKLEWLKPFPSQANFILCSVLSGSARELWQNLQKKGILVRYFDQPILQNYIRISVGKPEHTDALIKVLRELED
ncbi:MAG TPA: histidinol-phosphate transaminase [Dehalococcoidales bacterium]|nr:histidinol-phosphate transaminase [Dehalococcoidales bacterium]